MNYQHHIPVIMEEKTHYYNVLIENGHVMELPLQN